jgi:4a-hydroxytetrahydrobiopterin dehydratase
MSSELATRSCIPCQGGVPPLHHEEQQRLLAQLTDGWKVIQGHHLENEYLFEDFRHALAFTNHVGEIAEAAGHHPDLYLAWGKVRVTIQTHKIDGLTESDFILAAKIDAIGAGRG